MVRLNFSIFENFWRFRISYFEFLPSKISRNSIIFFVYLFFKMLHNVLFTSSHAYLVESLPQAIKLNDN